MKIDGYTVKSYITNLSTGERVPFESLSNEEKIEVEKKMINQMVKALGYEVVNMKEKE